MSCCRQARVTRADDQPIALDRFFSSTLGVRGASWLSQPQPSSLFGKIIQTSGVIYALIVSGF
ncbi:hypothetical protein QWZ13_00030 [Reinekea marina]|uniref:hypothetical protein n=1 Tax=Reinekea marina TaxID=1310421 RepID=UPI0025B39245|nr:hypothetical protein [Reinekea marina]MDN3647290.1 hypothetical protein [Reinekea marina]